MKVVAKKAGFFGGLYRKEGDLFSLPEVEVIDDKGKKDAKATKEATERQFSSKWMQKV